MANIDELKQEVLETPFSEETKEHFCRILDVTLEERKSFSESERIYYEASMKTYINTMARCREVKEEIRKRNLWNEMSEDAKKWVETVKIGIFLKEDGFTAEEIAKRVNLDIKYVESFVMKDSDIFRKIYER